MGWRRAVGGCASGSHHCLLKALSRDDLHESPLVIIGRAVVPKQKSPGRVSENGVAAPAGRPFRAPVCRRRGTNMTTPLRPSTARWAIALMLLASCLSVPARAADADKGETASKPRRLMYVCLSKDIAVFDIDAGHKFVRWIAVNSDPE